MRKGKRDKNRTFVAIEKLVMTECESWRQLSLRAKIFYLYLKTKYSRNHTGLITNNGKIQLHFSELNDLPGLSSRRAFYGAAKELIGAGWVERTNPGGIYRNPNTYKLTGKYDAML